MTRRSDIIKIFAIAALLGIAFYYLAQYGLSWPQGQAGVRHRRHGPFAGSGLGQFAVFICFASASFLNNKYTVVGQVISGMDCRR